MPWNSGREELLNMQKQKKMVDAMTPAQRSDPNLIKDRHKKAIADRAGCVSPLPPPSWRCLQLTHEVETEVMRFRFHDDPVLLARSLSGGTAPS